ncbi:isoflavone 7-O-methyltransferase [Medicago truncatula]|uniref:isoflavone 7-O-methyltransferase n=1 Tax=Medicago truncatula TaxID=3880 RepID=UPI000236690E|nr:isoflavone 7-O-methyltransferase [Medicago truncatula]
MVSTNDQLEALELFQGQSLLYTHMYASLKPMSLKCAVQLNIPEIIYNHGKPITLPDLVSTLKVPLAKSSLVKRLMRFLAHIGIFAIHGKGEDDHDQTYALTPASKLLSKSCSKDHCLTPMVLMCTDPIFMSLFHQLGDLIHGEVPNLSEGALGVTLWEFLEEKPAYSSLFNEAMASNSQMVSLALKNCSEVFEGIESIVDVGGGNGTTAKIICEAFPKVKCLVFDVPHVVANSSCESQNVSYVGGDIFKSIPKADAIMLKSILHDWSDENCIKILKTCKDSVSSKGRKGKVIIIDILINEKDDEKDITQQNLIMDISMMAFDGGKERTEKEWKHLFIEAGFKDYKIFPLFSYESLIEVYP